MECTALLHLLQWICLNIVWNTVNDDEWGIITNEIILNQRRSISSKLITLNHVWQHWANSCRKEIYTRPRNYTCKANDFHYIEGLLVGQHTYKCSGVQQVCSRPTGTILPSDIFTLPYYWKKTTFFSQFFNLIYPSEIGYYWY